MRFLADMGVDIRVVNWLRQRGHDAKHLRDEGLHRIPNGEIFAKAISENRGQKGQVYNVRLLEKRYDIR
jgi:predicted nuclease of predicted toxin-antitoxin system